MRKLLGKLKSSKDDSSKNKTDRGNNPYLEAPSGRKPGGYYRRAYSPTERKPEPDNYYNHEDIPRRPDSIELRRPSYAVKATQKLKYSHRPLSHRRPAISSPEPAVPMQSLSDLGPELAHRLIVGVDYGTTYTGVSYIDSSGRSTNKGVHTIRTFPGAARDAQAVWKTPSRLAYHYENPGYTTNQFGYQVLPKMKSYSWTKLLLDPESPPIDVDDFSLGMSGGDRLMTLPDDKTAAEVATDYLREIYMWTCGYLEKRMSPEVFKVTPIEFWFSHPAIWKETAREITRRVAKAAGFGERPIDQLFLIAEPEAAGIAALKEYSGDSATTGISPGDGIMICDCGGGTVDIISYKIAQVRPSLIFEELVRGDGERCGSTFIDREFHKWMSLTFGRSYDKIRPEKIGPGSDFMKDFERHKIDFDPENLDNPYDLRLVIDTVRRSQYYNSVDSLVTINGHIMLKFFTPVVEQIMGLLQKQLRQAQLECKSSKAISRVVLVGGFGDSDYLNKRVREWCDRHGINLTCPEHPQAAIAKGASLRGLDIAPIRRRSRYHYGFDIDRLFREGIDDEKSSYKDRWTGKKMCRGRMQWVIAKGQVIDEATVIEHDIEYTFTDGDAFEDYEDLCRCELDRPSEYRSDSAVMKVATLYHTARESDLAHFETKMFEGKRIWRAGFNRTVYMARKEGTLKYRVHHRGVELGTSEIRYDWTPA